MLLHHARVIPRRLEVRHCVVGVGAREWDQISGNAAKVRDAGPTFPTTALNRVAVSIKFCTLIEKM